MSQFHPPCADVLVHEATFTDNQELKAAKAGHSTARMAGRFAERLGCKSLILVRASARYTAASSVPLLAEAAGDASGYADRRLCRQMSVTPLHLGSMQTHFSPRFSVCSSKDIVETNVEDDAVDMRHLRWEPEQPSIPFVMSPDCCACSCGWSTGLCRTPLN